MAPMAPRRVEPNLRVFETSCGKRLCLGAFAPAKVLLLDLADIDRVAAPVGPIWHRSKALTRFD